MLLFLEIFINKSKEFIVRIVRIVDKAAVIL